MFPFARLLMPFALFLGGCAISPPAPTMSCAFKRHHLKVENPAQGLAVAGERDSSFAEAMADALVAPSGAVAPASVAPKSLLFLSGGSLHGAFGAGLLEQWRADSPGGVLPLFKVVTGISTGAILATPAFTSRTQAAVDRYSIDRESQLLTPFVRLTRKGDLTYGSYVRLIRKGALADLSPLREELGGMIDDAMLADVARGHRDRRLLAVGVIDVDSGEAVAIDLTDMAARWAAASDDGVKGRAKACYLEAILASSSAPMAALPVFIDNRMYIDGGARFGVFGDELGEMIRDTRLSVATLGGEPTRIYVVVNGDQQIGQRCGKADQSLCTAEFPTGGLDGAHKRWNFLDLALRSEKILANQVYRFSADRLILRAQAQNHQPHFAIIDESAMLAHEHEIDDPDLEPAARTENCAKWKERDRELMNPVQFFPRYMRCLIGYGRKAAKTLDWASGKPARNDF